MPESPATASVSPGEVLRDEIMARGWSMAQFAERVGLSMGATHEIVAGRGEITGEIASRLSKALGTSPELWVNLEARYRRGMA